MRLNILHEIRGRLRVHIQNKYSQADLDRIWCVLNSKPQIRRCKVYYATNDMTVEYTGEKREVLSLLCSLSPDAADVPEHALHAVTNARELKRQYTGKLIKKVAAHYVRSLLIPRGIRMAILSVKAARFIQAEKAKGNTVVMIGDGVNDSPALSAADVGVAISSGAAIAREIADITISENDLSSIIILRKLSTAMMRRIDFNYRSILSVNSGLIVLGVGGFAQPTTTAMLHNASTLGIGLLSTKKLL